MAANLISPTALELLVQPLQEDEKRSEKKATIMSFSQQPEHTYQSCES